VWCMAQFVFNDPAQPLLSPVAVPENTASRGTERLGMRFWGLVLGDCQVQGRASYRWIYRNQSNRCSHFMVSCSESRGDGA
jgi:hypothetical protein